MDDLVMTVRKVKKPVDPPKNVIKMNDFFDQKTAEILKNVFGNICPFFLERPCENMPCPWRHDFVHKSHVWKVLINSSADRVKEILRVSYKYKHLFITYVEAFTNLFIHHKSRAGIIELIKGCSNYEETIKCYFPIYDNVVRSHFLSSCEVVSLIISHHKDSPTARTIILNLIISTGPEIVHFLNYIEHVSMTSKIESNILDKIINLFVKYQRPNMSNIILNVLLTATPEDRRHLNAENVNRFINLEQTVENLIMKSNHSVKLKRVIDLFNHR
jgi:hypothetical protein